MQTIYTESCLLVSSNVTLQGLFRLRTHAFTRTYTLARTPPHYYYYYYYYYYNTHTHTHCVIIPK